MSRSYDGSLLRLAQDLGDRLLPAFDTPSGIPLSWVNLAKGVLRGEIRATCTACAGTLLLEFGLLSQLTGQLPFATHGHLGPILVFAPCVSDRVALQATPSTSATPTMQQCSCSTCAQSAQVCLATP